MTRKDIIEFLKSKKVEFNPTLKLAQLEELYKLHSGENQPGAVGTGLTQPQGSKEEPKSDMDKILGAIDGVVRKLGDIDSRVSKLEGPTGNEFKMNSKAEDIAAATESKRNKYVDENVIKIVEETLGIDFGIDMETFTDRPGFLFTVIVPERLSDMPPSTRPVIDPETGKYKVQVDGKTPVLEDYIPQDRRSRAIGSTQSYEAIRDHCNKVRSYIVSYYQKMSKPLPEFKVK